MKLLLERWNKYLKEGDDNGQLSLPLQDKEAPKPAGLASGQEAALNSAFKLNVLTPDQIFQDLERVKREMGRDKVEVIADPFVVLSQLRGKTSLNQLGSTRTTGPQTEETGLFLTPEEFSSLKLTTDGDSNEQQFKKSDGQITLPVFYDLASEGYDYDANALRQIRAKYINRILQIASEKTGNKKQAWFSPDGSNYRLNLKYKEQ